MSTKQAEKANGTVTTDATDPATIAANNVGGPAFPGDMPADIAALFAGTQYDVNATIAKATKRANTARKGRASTPLIDLRDINALKLALTEITSVKGDEAAAEFGYVTWVKHEDFVGKKKQITDWVADNNLSGIAVKVSLAKHAVSPVGYDPKKTTENKGQNLVYAVTLSRGEDDTADVTAETE